MFDDRVLQLGIEVNGQLLNYTNADISVKFTKTVNAKQNTCDAVISNLLVDTIDYLVTETSPWNPNGKSKIMTVMAGRASTGVERVFTGDMTSALPTSPPDRKLSMKAMTSANTQYKFSTVKSPQTIQLSTLAKKIADEYGLLLKFQATDKTIANYAYSGPLKNQIKKLQLVGDIDAFIDDDTMVVKDHGKGVKGEVRLISVNTGMIGSPTPDDKGIKVRVMFDPTIRLGDQIEIQSEINKSLNGQYVIYEMTGSLMTRGQDWYWDLSCNNDNIKSIAEKREAQRKKDAETEKKKK